MAVNNDETPPLEQSVKYRIILRRGIRGAQARKHPRKTQWPDHIWKLVDRQHHANLHNLQEIHKSCNVANVGVFRYFANTRYSESQSYESREWCEAHGWSQSAASVGGGSVVQPHPGFVQYQ